MEPTSAPGKCIAVCVDDFGLHEGVNDACLRLAALGRITAISCMAGAPQWRAGAARLAELPQENLDVGLHLDLTEYPVNPLMRWSLPALMLRTHAHLIDRAGLRTEIHAQLDLFERFLGRTPAHIDGHQHIHQLPVIRDTLVGVLLERYPGQRPWLRATRRSTARASGGFKPWLIEQLGSAALGALARTHGYPQNESLLGVYDFQGDAARYLDLLAQWIVAARHGDLLMCHTALRVAAQDPILDARCNEYAVFSGVGFTDLLARSGVGLAALSQIRSRR